MQKITPVLAFPNYTFPDQLKCQVWFDSDALACRETRRCAILDKSLSADAAHWIVIVSVWRIMQQKHSRSRTAETHAETHDGNSDFSYYPSLCELRFYWARSSGETVRTLQIWPGKQLLTNSPLKLLCWLSSVSFLLHSRWITVIIHSCFVSKRRLYEPSCRDMHVCIL